MHRPIEDGLEDYLTGRANTASYRALAAHLESCAECSAEVRQFTELSELMRELRAPEEMAPAAGFYARVMDRIEAQTANSFWSLFMEPVFGKRLALACLALFVLLSSAAWQTSPAPALHENNPVSILAVEQPQVMGEDATRNRSVVLTTLVSYSSNRGSVQQLPVSSD